MPLIKSYILSRVSKFTFLSFKDTSGRKSKPCRNVFSPFVIIPRSYCLPSAVSKSERQVDPFTSIDLFCNMKKSQCNHLSPTLSQSKLLSKGSQLERLALLSTETDHSSLHYLYDKTWLPMR